MDKNHILDGIKSGAVALENKQYQDAGRYFLISAKALYESLDNASPAIRSVRLKQAQQLTEQGIQLIKRNNVSNHGEGENYQKIQVTFDDIAGADDLKQTMSEKIILPIVHYEKAERLGIKPCSGILMYGPPGTGKTFFAKALAGELAIPFYEVNSEHILANITGNLKKLWRKFFIRLPATVGLCSFLMR